MATAKRKPAAPMSPSEYRAFLIRKEKRRLMNELVKVVWGLKAGVNGRYWVGNRQLPLGQALARLEQEKGHGDGKTQIDYCT